MTPKRTLSEQQLARMDESQRALFRALGYEVPDAASTGVEDSRNALNESADSDSAAGPESSPDA